MKEVKKSLEAFANKLAHERIIQLEQQFAKYDFLD